MREWMVVYTTNDLTEAHVIAGRLEVEGIKTLVHREPLATSLGITVGALGAVTIAVDAADYEQASAILEPDELHTLSDSNDDIIYYPYRRDDDAE